jgi:predicted Zn-dependent protease
VRQSASSAPFRDRADIERRLRVSGPGTYIGEMLASQDSALMRWAERDRPLYVWIQPSFAGRDWRPAYLGAARDAFVEWRSAGLPFDFTFVVDSGRADVHVYWAERLTEGRRIGMTYRVHDQHGWITGGHVVIAMQTVEGHRLPERLIRATALHEAGHLVGLNHTTDTTSIMTSSATGKISVGLADRATLRLLYSLPPGSIR